MSCDAEEFATLLVVHEAAWRRLVAVHVQDPSGHCAGCRSAVQPPVGWPCMLWIVAARAAELAGCRQL